MDVTAKHGSARTLWGHMNPRETMQATHGE